jgi:hypothetical protein
VNAALSLDQLNGSGAAFTFGDGYAFEFDRTDGRFTVSGPTVLRRYRRGSAVDIITPGKRFILTALRRGSMFDFLVDQKLVHSVQFDREIGSVGFAPRKGTMRIYAFGVSEMYPHSAPKVPSAPSTTTSRPTSFNPMAVQSPLVIDTNNTLNELWPDRKAAAIPRALWQSGFRAKEEWEDAGASTPEAALQTLLWAAREKAIARLDEVMFLPRHPGDDWYRSYTNDVPYVTGRVKQSTGVTLDDVKYETPEVAVIEMTMDGIPTNQIAVSKSIRMIRVGTEWKCDYPRDSFVVFKTRDNRPATSK